MKKFILREKLEEFFGLLKSGEIEINDVLRYILQIDKGLGGNKKGQISRNMSLSRVVEQRGVKSNYFGEDLIKIFK